MEHSSAAKAVVVVSAANGKGSAETLATEVSNSIGGTASRLVEERLTLSSMAGSVLLKGLSFWIQSGLVYKVWTRKAWSVPMMAKTTRRIVRLPSTNGPARTANKRSAKSVVPTKKAGKIVVVPAANGKGRAEQLATCLLRTRGRRGSMSATVARLLSSVNVTIAPRSPVAKELVAVQAATGQGSAAPPAQLLDTRGGRASSSAKSAKIVVETEKAD